VKVAVKTVPETMTLHNASLVGVVHCSGGRNIKSVGHYTVFS